MTTTVKMEMAAYAALRGRADVLRPSTVESLEDAGLLDRTSRMVDADHLTEEGRAAARRLAERFSWPGGRDRELWD